MSFGDEVFVTQHFINKYFHPKVEAFHPGKGIPKRILPYSLRSKYHFLTV